MYSGITSGRVLNGVPMQYLPMQYVPSSGEKSLRNSL